ncbi:MAG TPA: glycine cleavage T C-terminal barrel domain-containing protein [Gemmatimonadota bacterium]|nr:glycine cleavage T C-terminal barrel domain-containing protein [Gemmatimonadota bacterium]
MITADLFKGAQELGNFEAEYHALIDTCGLAARGDRGHVRVAGERRAEMLNGLVTQQVIGLSGAGRHALLLSAKGRVLTDLRIFPRTDELLLDVPSSGLTNLLATFNKYLPPMHATFEDVSPSLRLLGVYGPGAAAAVREALGRELPADHLSVDEVDIEGVSVLVVRNRRLAGDGLELVAPRASAAALAERLLSAVVAHGGRAVGARALDVARVESGVPAYGTDMDEENLAQETGLEADAISYDKGCYLGQEVVARVHFRGHVNQVLRGLRFDDSRPGRGVTLVYNGKPVGRVTSAVHSPSNGPIGLGYVRREIEPGTVLRVDEAPVASCTVVELPFRRATV